jgi:hypothetical protein
MRSRKQIEKEYFEQNSASLYPTNKDFKIYRVINPTTLDYTDFPEKPSYRSIGVGYMLHEIFDEVSFKRQEDKYFEQQEQINDIWYEELMSEYPDLPKKLLEICYKEAYDWCHSYGYDSVAEKFETLVKFAIKARGIDCV